MIKILKGNNFRSQTIRSSEYCGWNTLQYLIFRDIIAKPAKVSPLVVRIIKVLSIIQKALFA